MYPTVSYCYVYKSGHAKTLLYNDIYIAIYSTENLYSTYSAYLYSVSTHCPIYLFCVVPSPVHLSHLPSESLLMSETSLFLGRYILFSEVFFQTFPSWFYFSYKFFTLFIFIRSPSLHVSLHTTFISVLIKDFGRSGRDCSLKIGTYGVFYEKQDGRPKVAGSTIIFTAGVADLNEFHGCLPGIDLTRCSGSTLIVLEAVRIQKYTLSFTITMNSSAHRWMKSRKPLVRCPNMVSMSETHRP